MSYQPSGGAPRGPLPQTARAFRIHPQTPFPASIQVRYCRYSRWHRSELPKIVFSKLRVFSDRYFEYCSAAFNGSWNVCWAVRSGSQLTESGAREQARLPGVLTLLWRFTLGSKWRKRRKLRRLQGLSATSCFLRSATFWSLRDLATAGTRLPSAPNVARSK